MGSLARAYLKQQPNNVVQTHNGILGGCKEQGDIMKISGKWMDLEKATLSKVTQTLRNS